MGFGDERKRTSWNKGLHWNAEQRRKISRATYVAMQDPVIREKISGSKKGKSSWNKGMPSPWTVMMNRKRKGIFRHRQETIQKIRLWRPNEEQRRKMSLAHKGVPRPDISMRLRGMPKPPGHGEKVRKFQKEFRKTYFLLHPEKHPNRLMARQIRYGRGYISKAQWQVFALIKEFFTDAEINHAVACDQGVLFVDVAIPSERTAIEVDGSYWHRNPEKDVMRDKRLINAGWEVFHIRTEDVEDGLL